MEHLDQRVAAMQARGYLITNRSRTSVTLCRRRDNRRGLVHTAALCLFGGLALFGVWRVSWAFIAAGVVGLIVICIDYFLQRQTITVRLTLDVHGRIREELLGFHGQ